MGTLGLAHVVDVVEDAFAQSDELGATGAPEVLDDDFDLRGHRGDADLAKIVVDQGILAVTALRILADHGRHFLFGKWQQPIGPAQTGNPLDRPAAHANEGRHLTLVEHAEAISHSRNRDELQLQVVDIAQVLGRHDCRRPHRNRRPLQIGQTLRGHRVLGEIPLLSALVASRRNDHMHGRRIERHQRPQVVDMRIVAADQIQAVDLDQADLSVVVRQVQAVVVAALSHRFAEKGRADRDLRDVLDDLGVGPLFAAGSEDEGLVGALRRWRFMPLLEHLLFAGEPRSYLYIGHLLVGLRPRTHGNGDEQSSNDAGETICLHSDLLVHFPNVVVG